MITNISIMASNRRNVFNLARYFLRANSIFTRVGYTITKQDILTQKDMKLETLRKKFEEFSDTYKIGQKLRIAREYYTLEMSPPGFKEKERLKQDVVLAKDFWKSGCWKELTVKQAWLMFLVGLEVVLWFFLGETIGKRHIVGYKV